MIVMKRWYKKIELSVLLVLSMIVGLANKPFAPARADTKTPELSVVAKFGSEKIDGKTYIMKKGSSKKIHLLVTPTKSKIKAKYQSGKKNVVSISQTGVLKAKKAGTAKITIEVEGKGNFQKKISFKVKVVKQNNSGKQNEIPITLIVGGKKFAAKFYDNQTARELIKKMPMTLSMKELNGNEKYYYFNTELPAKEISPKQIQAGDIKLYGSDCLVAFYKTHTTSYQYTSVGYVEDVSGFVEAVGNGNVEITFQKG